MILYPNHCYFNPRSREGSDGFTDYIQRIVKAFQSTLPRGERQESSSYPSISFDISIHAPARGATWNRSFLYHAKTHFNPRSREGSDQKGTANVQRIRGFQSTLPRGERLCTGCMFQTAHANFNPRSREGSDATSAWLLFPLNYFNPRSREGSDAIKLSFVAYQCLISIHAPARGATFTGL